jgi:uncharacterized protein YutE (UPF0331/DUF86 family)
VVKPEVIRKRLGKAEEYVQILRALQKYSFEEFVSDPERYGSGERFLQLVIEVLLDLGSHVIAEENLGTVNSYSDIPDILKETGHVSSAQQETWIKMIGSQNTLVHDYVDIDRNIVYQVLQNNLEDMESLKRVFAQFL